MTKQEAIRILEQSCPKRPQKLWSVKRTEAIHMAIEALTHFNSTSNSIKNELNELSCSEKPNRSDVIKRQDAIDVAKQHWYKPDIAKALEELPSAQPELEDYTEMKQEFLRMASYIDVLLECSDEQRETLLGFISRMSEYMPWTERD